MIVPTKPSANLAPNAQLIFYKVGKTLHLDCRSRLGHPPLCLEFRPHAATFVLAVAYAQETARERFADGDYWTGVDAPFLVAVMKYCGRAMNTRNVSGYWSDCRHPTKTNRKSIISGQSGSSQLDGEFLREVFGGGDHSGKYFFGPQSQPPAVIEFRGNVDADIKEAVDKCLQHQAGEPGQIAIATYAANVAKRLAQPARDTAPGMFHVEPQYISRTLRGDRPIGRSFQQEAELLPAASEGDTSEESLLKELYREKPTTIGIIGEGGTGKSTLLEQLVYRMAERLKSDHRQPSAKVPFLIALPKCKPKQGTRLAKVIARQTPELSLSLVDSLCSEGRAVIFFDALDEVRGSRGRREAVLRWLDDELAAGSLGRCSWLLASRPWAVEQLHVRHLQFRLLQLRPLGDQEIAAYVRHCFTATPARGEALLMFLVRTPSLSQIASYPQHLMHICYSWLTAPGDMPASVAVINEQVLVHLLRQRGLAPAPTMRVLEWAAWQQWSTGAEIIPEDHLLTYLAQAKSEDEVIRGSWQSRTAPAILNRLIQHSGILTRRGPGCCVENHAYLEYLAARWLARQEEKMIRSFFCQKAWRPDWVMVLRLLGDLLWQAQRPLAVKLVTRLLDEIARKQDDVVGYLAFRAANMASSAGPPRTDQERQMLYRVCSVALQAWRSAVEAGEDDETSGIFTEAAAVMRCCPELLVNDLRKELRRSEHKAAVVALIRGIGSEATDSLLCAELRDAADGDVRRAVVSAVAACAVAGSDTASETLLHALRDPLPEIRAQACALLAEAKVLSAIPEFIRMLALPQAEDRVAAVEALGQLRPPETVALLLAQLQNSDTRVVAAAAKALQTIREPDSAIAIAREAARSKQEPSCLAMLEAIAAIIPSDNAAVLRPFLKHRLSSVRRLALSLLRTADWSPVLPDIFPLLDYRHEKDALVRREAALALVRSGVKTPPAALIRALDDPDGHVRQAAVTAIGALHAPEAQATLLETARGKDVFGQAGAGVGLILLLGGQKVVALLAQETLQATPKCRERLLGLLAWLANKPCTQEFLFLPNPTPDGSSRDMLPPKDAESLSSLVTDALVDPLIALAAKSPAERMAVTKFLSKLDDDRSFTFLCQALGDANAEVRAEAAYGLMLRENPAATSLLLSAIDDPSADVRRNAAAALGRLASHVPLDAVPQLLASKDADVRSHAVYIAGHMRNGWVIPQLARIAARATPFLAEQAIFSLGCIAGKRAGEALASLLDVAKGDALRAVMKGLLQCPSSYSAASVMRSPTGQRLRPNMLAKNKLWTKDHSEWEEESHLSLVCSLLANLGTSEAIHQLIALRSACPPGLDDRQWDRRLGADSYETVSALQEAVADGQEWAAAVLRRLLPGYTGDQHFTVLSNGSVVRRGSLQLA